MAARTAATPSAWASTPSPVGSSRPTTSGSVKARACATTAAATSPVGRVEQADDRRGEIAATAAAPARCFAALQARLQELPHDGDLVGRDERRRVADAGELVHARARAALAHRGAVAGASTSESAPRSTSVGQRIAS